MSRNGSRIGGLSTLESIARMLSFARGAIGIQMRELEESGDPSPAVLERWHRLEAHRTSCDLLASFIDRSAADLRAMKDEILERLSAAPLEAQERISAALLERPDLLESLETLRWGGSPIAGFATLEHRGVCYGIEEDGHIHT